MRDISGLRIMTLVMWKMFALLDKSALQYRTQVRDASYECVMNERGERRGRDSSQLTVQTHHPCGHHVPTVFPQESSVVA